jgi:hypothetical protein
VRMMKNIEFDFLFYLESGSSGRQQSVEKVNI